MLLILGGGERDLPAASDGLAALVTRCHLVDTGVSSVGFSEPQNRPAHIIFQDLDSVVFCDYHVVPRRQTYKFMFNS